MNSDVQEMRQDFSRLSHVFENRGEFSESHLVQGNVISAGGNVYLGSQHITGPDLMQQQALRMTLYYQTMNQKKSLLDSKKKASFDWIWTTDFAEWLGTEGDIFWISGKPGSGKSTLMNWLAQSDQVRSLLPQGSHWIILEFYFDFQAGSELANRPEGMLRLFLLQLIEHTGIEESIRKRHKGFNNSWVASREEMLKTISEVLKASKYRLCAFIDGLDEYDGKAKALTDYLLDLQARMNMKMILASRPESMLQRVLNRFPTITVQDHNTDTIQTYIKDASAILDPDEASELAPVWRDVVSLSNGVILWTTFVVDELIERRIAGATSTELKRVLHSYPKELHEIYDRILSKVPKDLELLVTIALSIIAAGGPLHTTDFFTACIALMIKEDPTYGADGYYTMPQFEARLQNVLGGLLEFEHWEGHDWRLDERRLYRHQRVQTQQRNILYLPAECDEPCLVRLVHQTLLSYLKNSHRANLSLPSDAKSMPCDLSIDFLDLTILQQANESKDLPIDVLFELEKSGRGVRYEYLTQRQSILGIWQDCVFGIMRAMKRLQRNCERILSPEQILNLYKSRIFRRFAALHVGPCNEFDSIPGVCAECTHDTTNRHYEVCHLRYMAVDNHWPAVHDGIVETKASRCMHTVEAAIDHLVNLLPGEDVDQKRSIANALDMLLDGVALKAHHLALYFIFPFEKEPRFVKRAREDCPEVALHDIEPCPWYHHKHTNLLYCWVWYSRDVPGSVSMDLKRLALLLDLGFDVNDQAYEHGTAMHALFQTVDAATACKKLPESETWDMTKFELLRMCGYQFLPTPKSGSILTCARKYRIQNEHRWSVHHDTTWKPDYGVVMDHIYSKHFFSHKYGLHSIDSTIYEILEPIYRDITADSDRLGAFSPSAPCMLWKQGEQLIYGTEEEALKETTEYVEVNGGGLEDVRKRRSRLWKLYAPSGYLILPEQ